MIPVDTCEPFFEYMRRYVELDADTMQLIASYMSEITFPQKHIILVEGGICNKVYFFQELQDHTIQIFRATQ